MNEQNGRGNRWGRGLIGAAIAVGSVVGIGAVAAAGNGPSQATRGEFSAFAAANASEQGIGGHAQMVRGANGTTKVSIHVSGLVPRATYDSHVHEARCAEGEAGAHYKFTGPVGGGATAGENEIWPGPVVANGGGVANNKTTVDAIAGEKAVSVVIHRSTGQKIACADLS